MRRVGRGGAFLLFFAAAGLACWYGSYLAARLRAPLAPPPVVPSQPLLTPDQLRHLHVNEAGLVPILMYHDITRNERFLGRSIVHFKHDLDRLYSEGYRPVSISEYLANRMDLPAGKSPVVLTFDDSRKSQFRYLNDGSLDPDCAVAILNAFSEKHPDFARKATFFVLPKCAFRQAGSDRRKLRLLTAWGYEIGNHTVTHPNLSRLTDAGVQKEIAGCVRMLHALIPDTRIDTIAFPGGNMPRSRALIAAGQYGGVRYANRAGFLAAEGPAPSAISKAFRPLRIERIQACEGYTGVDYWLDFLKTPRFPRYVSDGDPHTVCVPQRCITGVDRSRIRDAKIRVY